MNYNGKYPQNPRVYNSNYIFKERNLYHSSLCEWRTFLWIMKTHTHAHACTHTHTQEKTLIHTYIHTHKHIYTKCSFVIGGPSLWKHLPDNVKRLHPSSCLSGFKKRSYLVNLSKYRIFLNFVTVLLPLFDLFVAKNSRLITCYRIRQVLTLREVK